MSELRLGELQQLTNIFVEFGENKTGYVGGYVQVDGEATPVVFTAKELERAITRAAREQENFSTVQFVERPSWGQRFFSLFGLGDW